MAGENTAVVETIISTQQQEESTELIELVKDMNPSEQKELTTFIQGARFARSMDKKNRSA